MKIDKRPENLEFPFFRPFQFLQNVLEWLETFQGVISIFSLIFFKKWGPKKGKIPYFQAPYYGLREYNPRGKQPTVRITQIDNPQFSWVIFHGKFFRFF